MENYNEKKRTVKNDLIAVDAEKRYAEKRRKHRKKQFFEHH